MIDHSAPGTTRRKTGALHLPPQAAPINRTGTASNDASSNAAGIEGSGLLDDLLKPMKPGLPPLPLTPLPYPSPTIPDLDWLDLF
ncbi:hypothetical protein MOQ72_43270 [Saccharopolyspora sp. K220]|uniref:hypothetical protein n=1 Tax=Saccharopolyspora soli TaxID=2926618 RepID=UPI001F583E3C|nr:hypothetical protein [Saccharopolyspora soli]MCI2424235.1 hypothetical protein [Saccharopolyspora soli]